MTTREKILLFRSLFTIITVGRLIVKHYIVDERLRKQVNHQTNYLCRQLSDYLNQLYSLKQ